MTIPRAWQQGEIAIIGLGASGLAAAELLARDGARVYASDARATPILERTATPLPCRPNSSQRG